MMGWIMAILASGLARKALGLLLTTTAITLFLLNLRRAGGVVVEHQMHVARLENGAVDATQKAQKFLRPLPWFASKPLPGNGWRGRHSPMTMPDFTSSAANSVVVPWRL
jgi:hypothetical protein